MVFSTGSVGVACLIDALREIDLFSTRAGKGPQAKTPNPTVVFGGKSGAFPRTRLSRSFARVGKVERKATETRDPDKIFHVKFIGF